MKRKIYGTIITVAILAVCVFSASSYASNYSADKARDRKEKADQEKAELAEWMKEAELRNKISAKRTEIIQRERKLAAIDTCHNLENIQKKTPAGLVSIDHVCYERGNLPKDWCPNIAGLQQESVLWDHELELDQRGNCTLKTDAGSRYYNTN